MEYSSKNMKNGGKLNKSIDNPHKSMYYDSNGKFVAGNSRNCFGSEKRRLDGILERKQNERREEFDNLKKNENCRTSNEANAKILNLEFDDLVQSLHSRKFTAVQVLQAFIGRALEATAKVNAITDFNPEAWEKAKELDDLSDEDVQALPLFGIPVCIKDDTNVKGLDTSHGFAKRLYNPAQESAVLVKILEKLGAIPFCKTNVPQTLFTYGSDNPVFGTTFNAFNQKLSPGGSSSGTGALVGSKGCLFGTGSDIGGSLRIPAHFNGISAIKPTVTRLSDIGLETSLPNLVGMTAAPGIIGQNAKIVSTVFKHLCQNFLQNEYDAFIPKIPWDQTAFESKEKLRIGYITSIPFFPLMGDTEEVVLKARSSLEANGHTLVPFTLPDAYKYMNIVSKFILADNARHFKKCWKGEEVAKCVSLVYMGSKIPRCAQSVIGKLMNVKIPFVHSKRMGAMFGKGAASSTDVWDAMGEKREIIAEIYSEWKKLNLDAIISPLFPFPAPPLNYPGLLPVAVCYSMIWNLVDFPAGVLKFGNESGKNISCYDDEGDMCLKMAKKGIKSSIGAPISVQVVGLPFCEEVVLRVMNELEDCSNLNKN